MEHSFYHWLRETGSLLVLYVAIGLCAIPFALIAFFFRGSPYAGYIAGACLAVSFVCALIIWPILERKAVSLAVVSPSLEQRPLLSVDIAYGIRSGLPDFPFFEQGGLTPSHSLVALVSARIENNSYAAQLGASQIPESLAVLSPVSDWQLADASKQQYATATASMGGLGLMRVS